MPPEEELARLCRAGLQSALDTVHGWTASATTPGKQLAHGINGVLRAAAETKFGAGCSASLTELYRTIGRLEAEVLAHPEDLHVYYLARSFAVVLEDAMRLLCGSGSSGSIGGQQAAAMLPVQPAIQQQHQPTVPRPSTAPPQPVQQQQSSGTNLTTAVPRPSPPPQPVQQQQRGITPTVPSPSPQPKPVLQQQQQRGADTAPAVARPIFAPQPVQQQRSFTSFHPTVPAPPPPPTVTRPSPQLPVQQQRDITPTVPPPPPQPPTVPHHHDHHPASDTSMSSGRTPTEFDLLRWSGEEGSEGACPSPGGFAASGGSNSTSPASNKGEGGGFGSEDGGGGGGATVNTPNHDVGGSDNDYDNDYDSIGSLATPKSFELVGGKTPERSPLASLDSYYWRYNYTPNYSPLSSSGDGSEEGGDDYSRLPVEIRPVWLSSGTTKMKVSPAEAAAAAPVAASTPRRQEDFGFNGFGTSAGGGGARMTPEFPAPVPPTPIRRKDVSGFNDGAPRLARAAGGGGVAVRGGWPAQPLVTSPLAAAAASTTASNKDNSGFNGFGTGGGASCAPAVTAAAAAAAITTPTPAKRGSGFSGFRGGRGGASTPSKPQFTPYSGFRGSPAAAASSSTTGSPATTTRSWSSAGGGNGGGGGGAGRNPTATPTVAAAAGDPRLNGTEQWRNNIRLKYPNKKFDFSKKTLEGRITVRNLRGGVQEADLRALLEPYGKIVDFCFPLTPAGKTQGFAHVKFESIRSAFTAVLQLKDKAMLDGAPIAVKHTEYWEEPRAPRRNATATHQTEVTVSAAPDDSERAHRVDSEDQLMTLSEISYLSDSEDE